MDNLQANVVFFMRDMMYNRVTRFRMDIGGKTNLSSPRI